MPSASLTLVNVEAVLTWSSPPSDAHEADSGLRPAAVNAVGDKSSVSFDITSDH